MTTPRDGQFGSTGQTLRRLALGDQRLVAEILGADARNDASGTLEPRTTALVRLSALMASGASVPSYSDGASYGLACGASVEDLVDTLVAIAPIVGSAMLVDAAPKLALALGYDIDVELEELEEADDLEGSAGPDSLP